MMKKSHVANVAKVVIGIVIMFFLLGLIVFFVQTIFVSAQVPSGWGPEIRLTNANGDSRRAEIAVGPNGNLQIAFDSTTTVGYPQIFYTVRDPNGNEIVPIKRVSFDADNAQRADIAVDANNDAFIFWDEVRDAAPLNWELHGEKVSGADGRELIHKHVMLNSRSLFPSTTVDRRTGEVYLVFSKWGDWWGSRGPPMGIPEMYFAKFDNNLNPLITPRALLDRYTLPIFGNYPDIAVGPDGTLHMVRESLSPPPNWGSYLRLDTNGQNVGNEINFVGPGVSPETDVIKPRIAVNQLDPQNNVHIAFISSGAYYYPGGHVVYMKIRNGQVIISPIRLYTIGAPGTFLGADEVAIAADDQGRAHILVIGRLFSTPNSKIFYYIVNADGSVVGPVDLGVPTYPEQPSIALGQTGSIFIAWNDYLNRNMDVSLRIKSS